MPTYIASILAGTADPFWTHLVLLSLSVLGGMVVGAAIIFEAEKYSNRVQQSAKWAVIAAVAVESACTISLFVIDECISGAQQSKIVSLETKLAPRTLTVIAEGEIATDLRPFAPIEGAERPATQSVAVFPTSTTFEAARLAESIAVSLEKAGWSVNRNHVTMGYGDLSINGVGMFLPTGGLADPAADAVILALAKQQIFSFKVPTRYKGCAEIPALAKAGKDLAKDPFCSSFSIEVGDHP
jgi:hypothetical protein